MYLHVQCGKKHYYSRTNIRTCMLHVHAHVAYKQLMCHLLTPGVQGLTALTSTQLPDMFSQEVHVCVYVYTHTSCTHICTVHVTVYMCMGGDQCQNYYCIVEYTFRNRGNTIRIRGYIHVHVFHNRDYTFRNRGYTFSILLVLGGYTFSITCYTFGNRGYTFRIRGYALGYTVHNTSCGAYTFWLLHHFS